LGVVAPVTTKEKGWWWCGCVVLIPTRRYHGSPWVQALGTQASQAQPGHNQPKSNPLDKTLQHGKRRVNNSLLLEASKTCCPPARRGHWHVSNSPFDGNWGSCGSRTVLLPIRGQHGVSRMPLDTPNKW